MAMAARDAATRPIGAGPGKTVPGTLTYRGADWFYDHLFVTGAKTRVAAPLVSTLVFRGGRADRWLFSTREGQVAKKRAIAIQAVGDSFRRVALAHSSNDAHVCAVLRHSDGSLRTLGEDEFDAFCSETIPDAAGAAIAAHPHLVCAHAYVHSRGGDGAVWRHSWSAPPDSDPTGPPASRTTKHPGVLTGAPAAAAAEAVQEVHQRELQDQLDGITAGIVASMEERTGERIAHIELDYSIDQGGRLFLLYPNQVVTRPLELAARREALAASQRMAAGGGGSGPDLEALGAGRRAGATASRGGPSARGRAGTGTAGTGMVAVDEGKEDSGGEGKEDAGGGVRDLELYLRRSKSGRGNSKAEEHAMRRARAEAEAKAATTADAASQARWKSMAGEVMGHGWRGAVLVVETDAAQGLPAVEVLVAEGFAVMVAQDGPAGLEATRQHGFDCALVATELPSLGGVELTKILRQREQGVRDAVVDSPQLARLPVVAFTSRTTPDDLRRYMDAGLDGCVVKPLDVSALINTLTTAVPEPADGPPPDWTEARQQQELQALAVEEHRRSHALAQHVTPGLGGLGGTAITPLGGMASSTVSSMAMGASRTRSHAHGGSAVPVSPMRETAGSFADSVHASAAAAGVAPGGTVAPTRMQRGHGSASGAASTGKLPAMRGRDPTSIGPPLQPPAQALPIPTGVADETQGIFQLDAETAMPYAVIGRERAGAPVFHFVVCQDVFDTFESQQIFYRAVCSKYPGVRALLFNYPGQAFTEWRRDALLNNEYLAGCLQALLVHLSDNGTGEFALDGGRAPFHLVGLGTGGSVASYFASAYHGTHPNLRSLITVNGFAYVDSHLAGVMHDCMNVFACSPPSRPDLPVYFFSRFLFSPGYLAKVGAPLALNLYTAVHNPITLDGRIQLCQGVLSNVDCRDSLEALSLPVICVVSSKDGFVKPSHVQAYVNARGGEERSLRRALKTRKRCCVVWLRAGHEVLQEARKPMTHLIEQLATGYHERHDVAFLPLSADDSGPAAHGGSSKASQVAQRAMAGAAARTAGMRGSGAHGGLDASGVSASAAAPRMYEEKYLDSVVGAVKAARAADQTAGGQPGSAADDGGQPSYQYGDAPAALATAPPTPPGIRPGGASGSAATTTAMVRVGGEPFENDWIAGSTLGRTDMGPEATAERAAQRKAEMEAMNMPTLNLDPTSAAFETREIAEAPVPVPGAGGGEEPVGEVKEFMQWRVRRNRKRLQRLEGCVVQMQRCWRAYLARTLVARMRQQRGALTLQRWWRGCLGRMVAEDRRREIWAARVVQRYWRGHSGRAMAWQMQSEERAARTVQRSWRGWRARRFVDMLRNARHEAAVRIQSMYRKRRAMRNAWELRDKHNASINVQRVWRGFLGRARARKERDKYLFSKSQSQGIEFGRQMLLEHKLHGTKLQSEVSLLTKEKLETEEAVEAVLAEIATFEAGVRALEKEMVELSRAEAEAASTLDEESKAELRENKMRLDREFGEMLVKIADRREKLQALEKKLQTLDRTRQAKKEELADLERKLVVLLEEQQRELAAIKARQAKAGEQLVEDAVAAVTGQIAGSAGGPMAALGNGAQSTALVPAGGGGVGGGAMVAMSGAGGASSMGGPSGPSAQERAEANALMASTETMMKFGFMSMSLTYFSSLNMIRAMRKVGAANTVLANPTLQGGGGGGNPMAAMAMAMGGAVGGGGGGMLPQAALGATGSTFRPGPRPGETTRDSRPDVSLWTVADVGAWLDTLSLGQYKDAFADAAVDGAFLFDLTDEDLRNTLGIEHALHRKKVLHAIKRLRDKERGQAAQMMLGDAGMAASGAGYLNGGGVDQQPSSTLSQVPQQHHAGASASVAGPGSVAPQSSTQLALPGAAASAAGTGAGALRLDELMSWVRHNKGKKLSEALRPLPDRRYDDSQTRVQFVPDYGTQYEDGVSRLPFHMNLPDEHGNTLLGIATQNGHMRICQLLCKKGANPNHQNSQGQTPMHYAMSYGYSELGQWLVDTEGGNADDTLMNQDGLTPYDGLEA